MSAVPTDETHHDPGREDDRPGRLGQDRVRALRGAAERDATGPARAIVGVDVRRVRDRIRPHETPEPNEEDAHDYEKHRDEPAPDVAHSSLNVRSSKSLPIDRGAPRGDARRRFEATVSIVLANGFVSGTVSPTTASVLVGSVPATLTGGRFNVSQPAGRVAVEVTAAGFKPHFTNVTVVAFQTTWANASLLPVTGSATSQSSSVPPYLILAIAGVGAVAALAAGLLLMRRRRSPPAAARPPSGAT